MPGHCRQFSSIDSYIKSHRSWVCILSFRDHHCSHHDNPDGERPLLLASSVSHQSLGRLLLDLLCVCVRGPHRVCLRSLQRRLQAQGESQGEGKQAHLRGEELVLIIMVSMSQTTMFSFQEGVLLIMSMSFNKDRDWTCSISADNHPSCWPSAGQQISIEGNEKIDDSPAGSHCDSDLTVSSFCFWWCTYTISNSIFFL